MFQALSVCVWLPVDLREEGRSQGVEHGPVEDVEDCAKRAGSVEIEAETGVEVTGLAQQDDAVARGYDVARQAAQARTVLARASHGRKNRDNIRPDGRLSEVVWWVDGAAECG